MSRYSRQMVLLPELEAETQHGGEIRLGKRKGRRPIAVKRVMHVTLRSSKAKGKYSFLLPKHARFIENLLSELSKTYGVKLYEKANSGNHLHLAAKPETRKGFQNFLRVLAARIATYVTGARKGNPFGKFWDALAYSRIVEWGKAYENLIKYIQQNTLEALGFIPYVPRKNKIPRPAG